MALVTIPVDTDNPTNQEIFAAITEVFNKLETVESNVGDLVTEAIGSWQWDKQEGLMTMLTTEGDEAFKFEVSDSAEEATRERRQDLE